MYTLVTDYSFQFTITAYDFLTVTTEKLPKQAKYQEEQTAAITSYNEKILN